MLLKDLTVKDFILELGSNSPAPGGGSASNLTINCGIALIKMACLLSIGKKKCEERQEDFKKIVETIGLLEKEFIDAMDEDAESFNKVMSAIKLPKEDKKRKGKILKATVNCALVPLKSAEKIIDFVKTADFVVKYCNDNCKSDALCGKEMIKTGIKGLIYNVHINIDGLEKTEEIKDIYKRLKNIEKRIKK